MSYTKDFLESKSQQYPEILKMTDEEALRYLDFMGELVESVDDSPTDIDEGYNLGGRVGFAGGGGDQDGPTGPGGISPGPGGPGGGMVAGASPVVKVVQLVVQVRVLVATPEVITPVVTTTKTKIKTKKALWTQ